MEIKYLSSKKHPQTQVLTFLCLFFATVLTLLLALVMVFWAKTKWFQLSSLLFYVLKKQKACSFMTFKKEILITKSVREISWTLSLPLFLSLHFKSLVKLYKCPLILCYFNKISHDVTFFKRLHHFF